MPNALLWFLYVSNISTLQTIVVETFVATALHLDSIFTHSKLRLKALTIHLSVRAIKHNKDTQSLLSVPGLSCTSTFVSLVNIWFGATTSHLRLYISSLFIWHLITNGLRIQDWDGSRNRGDLMALHPDVWLVSIKSNADKWQSNWFVLSFEIQFCDSSIGCRGLDSSFLYDRTG